MLRFSRVKLEGQFLGKAIESCECLLDFIGREEVGHLRAPGWYQEKGAPKDQLELFKQVRHVFQVMHIPFGNTCVHLNGKAKFVGPVNCFQCSCKRSRYAAKCV